MDRISAIFDIVRLQARLIGALQGRFVHIAISVAMTMAMTMAIAVVVAAPAAAEEQYDIRVLVDISGSMKSNDPSNLRQPAVELLAELLPQGAQAGIWTFGEKVTPLVPLGEVNREWRQQVTQRSRRITARDQWTQLGLGMDQVTQDWRQPAPNVVRSLIILTDGKVDVSRNEAENQNARQQVTDDILPRLKDSAVTIHTIALSDRADQALLKQLALTTDGQYSTIDSADKLAKAFVGAFDKAVDQDQLPISDNTFAVDGSVEEFTLLIYRLPDAKQTRLVAPNQQTLTKNSKEANLSWFSTNNFDLITLKDPSAGEWQISGELDPDNRVTIVSDLKLSVTGLPNNILQGELIDVEVVLREEGQPIKRAEFLSLLDIEFKQTHIDSEQVWQGMLTSYNASKIKTPVDGIYRARLKKTLVEGAHEFLVTVDGKTFKRQKKVALNVIAEVVKVLVVEEPSLIYPDHSQYFLNLVPIEGVLVDEKSKISATITDPKGQSSSAEALATPFGTWRIDVPPSAGNGQYQATIRIQGETETGREVELLQEGTVVEYKGLPEEPSDDTDLFDAEPEPAPPPEPEPAPPEPPVEPPETPEPEPEPTEPEAEEGASVLMFAALGVGNVLLVVLGFLVYRFYVKRQNAESSLAEQRLTEAAQKRQETLSQIEAELHHEEKQDEADLINQTDMAESEEDEEIDEALSNALDLDISIDDDDDLLDEDDDEESK